MKLFWTLLFNLLFAISAFSQNSRAISYNKKIDVKYFCCNHTINETLIKKLKVKKAHLIDNMFSYHLVMTFDS